MKSKTINEELGLPARTNVKTAMIKIDSLIRSYESMMVGPFAECKESFQDSIAKLRAMRAELASKIGK